MLKKRVVKTPKLYFLDTGLACWLTKWTSAEVLQSGAMFETFVVIENNGTLCPVEIKKSTNPKKSDASSFAYLRYIKNIKAGSGTIICMNDSVTILDKDLFAIPCTFI